MELNKLKECSKQVQITKESTLYSQPTKVNRFVTGILPKDTFTGILKTAELGHHRLYSLRHTYATLLLASGENMKVIKERLRHADVNLTLSTYSQF